MRPDQRKRNDTRWIDIVYKWINFYHKFRNPSMKSEVGSGRASSRSIRFVRLDRLIEADPGSWRFRLRYRYTGFCSEKRRARPKGIFGGEAGEMRVICPLGEMRKHNVPG